MSLVMRAASLALLAASMLGLYWSFRYSRADWLSLRLSEAARVRATQLAPDDADAWLRLADIRAEKGPQGIAEYLHRAAAHSHDRSRIWIQLGLDAEAQRNYGEAERDLKEAVQVDHDFIPLWTLTNFYFRRGDAPNFSASARRTLAFANGSFDPIFRMCWAIGKTGDQILSAVIPDRQEVLAAYLHWLANQNRLDEALPVAQRLLRHYPQESRDVLLAYCDHLLSSNRINDAVTLWNELNADRIVSAGKIAPGLLTNADFHSQPLNSGFDWHVESPPGLQIMTTKPGLNLNFSGTEADHCVILTHPVLVQIGRTYKLSYQVKRSGLEAGAGLRWIVSDIHGTIMSPILKSGFSPTPRDIASTASDAGEYTFLVPQNAPDPALAQVALVYDREPASARMEGWIQIQKVTLEQVP